MNSLSESCRWHKVVVAALAIAGLTTFISPMALRADDAPTTKPAAKIPEPEVKETEQNPVLATINGIPISREAFDNLLMATGGPKLFGQLMPLILAQDACNVAGITIKDTDIQAERTRILDNIAKQYPTLKDAERDQVLSTWLQRQGVTSSMEFRFLLERTACLRALAKGRAAPTEKQVQEAWDADNADKVDVLDIVIPDFNAAADLRKFVDASSKSPTETAKSMASMGQSKGYRVNEAVISKAVKQVDPVKKLTDLAFQLKEGELSASTTITTGEGKPVELHVIYCIKIIPATNKTMTAADREKLTTQMTEAMESDFATRLMQNLMNRARVEIKDKTLRAYYEELNKAQLKAQEDAKEKAATATAPGPK